MKVIYKLKEWYDLQEASERFSETLAESITIKNILEFAGTGKIDLCWYLRYRSAIPCEYFQKPKMVDGKRLLANYPHKLGTSNSVDFLNGYHTLSVRQNKELFDYCREAIRQTQHQPNLDKFDYEDIPFNGLIVGDESGKLWLLVQKMSRDRFIEKGVSSELSWDHVDRYTEQCNWPKLSELGVTKSEVEYFEASAQKTKNRSVSSKERTTLLKLVIGMAVEQYGYRPNAARNDATGNIATDLETNGIPLDRDTILKWLREASELLPNESE